MKKLTMLSAFFEILSLISFGCIVGFTACVLFLSKPELLPYLIVSQSSYLITTVLNGYIQRKISNAITNAYITKIENMLSGQK